jgi:membrane-bound inhibitor of C-type lysozyme
MKKAKVFGLLVGILALGLVFVGCSNDGTIDNGDSTPPPAPPPEYIETMTYTSTDKKMEVVFTRTAQRSFQVITGDAYWITLDGEEISRGNVWVDGYYIYFTSGDGKTFQGILSTDYLSIPRIEYGEGQTTSFINMRDGSNTSTNPDLKCPVCGSIKINYVNDDEDQGKNGWFHCIDCNYEWKRDFPW